MMFVIRQKDLDLFRMVVLLCAYHPKHPEMALCELCQIIDGFRKLVGEKKASRLDP